MGGTATAVHGEPLLQRCCGKTPCDGSGSSERELRRHPTGLRRGPDLAPPIVHDVLASGGRPLADPVRRDMETRLDEDFSTVRIHTDQRAGESATAVSAKAYTVGQHVVFNAGEYRPQTSAGRSVLAHELAHTIQQRGTAHLARSPLKVGADDDVAERQADAIAAEASRSDRHPPPAAPTGSASPPALRRLGDLTKVPPGLACPVASSTPTSVFTSIEFSLGSSTLSPGQVTELQNVIAAWEAAGTSPTIRLDGYASTDGSDETNWQLSCDRAFAVFAELTAHTSGPPGIPDTSIDTFVHGETTEFGPTLPANRRVTLSTSLPLPAPVCTHPGTSRTVSVQPVFLRTDASDTSPTGGTFGHRLGVANRVWGKLGVAFNASSPVTIDSALKTSGSTLAERSSVRALRSGSGVEIFVLDNPLTSVGGGATTDGGTAAAKVVIGEGGSVSTTAHELGHVLGIKHPGQTGTARDGEANTIMDPTRDKAVENARNTMTNYRAIRFPVGSGSTCLTPDP